MMVRLKKGDVLDFLVQEKYIYKLVIAADGKPIVYKMGTVKDDKKNS